MKNDTQSNLTISVVQLLESSSSPKFKPKSNKNVDFHFGTQGQEAEEESIQAQLLRDLSLTIKINFKPANFHSPSYIKLTKPTVPQCQAQR